MPGLQSEVVVDDTEVARVDAPKLEGLAVPPLGEGIGLVLADDVEVVLILGDDKVVEANELDELAENVMLPPLLAVDDDHSGVEVILGTDAKDLLDIGGSDRDGRDDGILDSGEVLVADVDVEEFGNVSNDRGVGVDVDGFVVLLELISDDEAEIGGKRIVVTNRELVDDVVEVGFDVIEGDGDVLGGHRLDGALVLLGDIGVEDVNLIMAAGRCVRDKGNKRHGKKFHVFVVAAEEDGDGLFFRFAVIWHDRTSFRGALIVRFF